MFNTQRGVVSGWWCMCVHAYNYMYMYKYICLPHAPGRRERRREVVRALMEEKDRSAKVSSSGMP